MRVFRPLFSLVFSALFLSCASGYKSIDPDQINYFSHSEDQGVSLQYKHGLLDKKYGKKEEKTGVKLVAVKITNNTENPLTVGDDIRLTIGKDRELTPLDQQQVFSTLKQGSLGYLFYLLLTPVNLYVTKTDNGVTETSTTPIGLVLGPGLAGGNMIAAGSANKKFETDLLKNDIYGVVIPPGESRTGLVGIYMNTYEAIGVKLHQHQEIDLNAARQDGE